MRKGLASKTRALITRVENGDAHAAFDLARLYRPDDINDFVDFVCPGRALRPELFRRPCRCLPRL
jgi:hypothetical protein